jgi:hypothetical protein
VEDVVGKAWKNEIDVAMLRRCDVAMLNRMGMFGGAVTCRIPHQNFVKVCLAAWGYTAA